ncbi:hypothetical protein M0R45_017832 [Rubus argutus]|uniref:Cystatin domain-containing protein n=1 Tax=Rubus argutus TaxID=59490 RepID=A0AAW1XWV2_RUBAR
MPHLNLGYSSRHPLGFLSVLLRPCIQRLPAKKIEPEHQIIPEIFFLGASPIADSSRYCPRVVINAHFALEEFNKQKNAQLQFVRVVKAYNQLCSGGGLIHRLLTLETIDADNVIRIYQAIVKEYSTGNPPVQLLLFGLVADNGNGSLLKLIDNRCAGRLGPTDNRRVGQKIIKVQIKRQRYSLEEEILSTLHILPLK